MSILTGFQISKLYELYNDIDITFTKDIVSTTLFSHKETFIRFGGSQKKCLLYSTSMNKGRVIVNTGDNFISKVKNTGGLVSLRLAFNVPNKHDIISFFINAKVTGYSAYTEGGSDLNYAFLSYTQRPPDDLIIILGQLLEANINFQKRKDFRIIINNNNYIALGFTSRDLSLIIENIPRKAVVVDLSASGIMAIGVKAFKFHLNKELIVKFNSATNDWQIKGQIVRINDITGRNDVVFIGIKLIPETIPVSFKMSIENYLKTTQDKEQPPAAGQAAVAEQPPAAGQAAVAEQPPAAGQAAVAEQPPAAGQAAGTGQAPAAGQAAGTGQTPAAGQAAVAAQPPAQQK
ncbi:MAG: PilZ domain-containing protein [Spirochaetaceae bacterium]|nr:PilZ domain-containing protein [Spirochaetaceae bacterium]